MLTGSQRPPSFQLAEIDAFLPMDEDDFAFGQEPIERAAMAGTIAAGNQINAAATSVRSLFVSDPIYPFPILAVPKICFSDRPQCANVVCFEYMKFPQNIRLTRLARQVKSGAESPYMPAVRNGRICHGTIIANSLAYGENF